MAVVEHPNLEILQIAAEKLGGLVEEVVFLGGCATNLLITDSAAPPPRVTRDVEKRQNSHPHASVTGFGR